MNIYATGYMSIVATVYGYKRYGYSRQKATESRIALGNPICMKAKRIVGCRHRKSLPSIVWNKNLVGDILWNMVVDEAMDAVEKVKVKVEESKIVQQVSDASCRSIIGNRKKITRVIENLGSDKMTIRSPERLLEMSNRPTG